MDIRAWAAAMPVPPMRCARKASCLDCSSCSSTSVKACSPCGGCRRAVLPGIGIDPQVSREWLAVACGFAVIVGHVYPVWFEFRGGKGAATVIGVVAALELQLLAPLLAELVPRAGADRLCRPRHHAVAGDACSRGLCFRAAQHSAAELLHRYCRIRRLHASKQYRAHARRPREPCTKVMAISIPAGIEHPMLLVLLADGQLRSGEWLAEQLEQSRAAVWKGIERLRALGNRGAGDRPAGLSPAAPGGVAGCPAHRCRTLHRDTRSATAPTGAAVRGRFDQHPAVGQGGRRRLGAADVCCSEVQHAGRGRQGRRWIAPFGAGIAMSMAWTFSDGARRAAGLEPGGGGCDSARSAARGCGRRCAQVAERHLVRGPQNRRRADRDARRGRGARPRRDRRRHQRVAITPAARREIEASGAHVAAVGGCLRRTRRRAI